MFHTSVRAMDGAAEELQRQLRKLNQAIEAVQDVNNRLNGLSGMDAVRRDLGKELFRMEQERKNLFSLHTVLRQAARCYAGCESGIIEYAECGRRRMAVPEWYQVGLGGDAMNLAKQIIF